MLSVGALALVVSTVGSLRGFSEFLFDRWLRFSAPVALHDIVVVAINSDDWTTTFKGSPLDPKALADLVTAIAKGGPRAIAVDIDTSDHKFEPLGKCLSSRTPRNCPDPEFQTLSKHPFDGTPVVWGATAEETGRDQFRFFPVLGGASSQHLGVAVLPRDGDGVIRGYWREVTTQIGDEPTLGFAAACLSNLGSPCITGDPAPRLLSFSRRLPHWQYFFDTYSARDILKAAKDPTWPKNSLFHDKIVLVGGVYDEHERYWTPLGRMWGVEVIGQVIETELGSPLGNPLGGPRRPSEFVEFIASTVLGALLIVVYSSKRLTFGWALGASAVVIVCAPPVLSFLCWHNLASWSSLVPIPLAVLLEENLYELHSKIIGESPDAPPPTTPS